MAGITIQKLYTSTSLTSAALANNWTVLVFGVTTKGPTEATLIQRYSDFIEQFGQPTAENNTRTYNYINFLLNNGVPVLFKRIYNGSDAIAVVKNASDVNLFTMTAKSSYSGDSGNHIRYKMYTVTTPEVTDPDTQEVITPAVTNGYFVIDYSDTTETDETFNLGVVTTDTTYGDLLFDKLNEANFSSNFVTIKFNSVQRSSWKTLVVATSEETAEFVSLSNDGTDDVKDLASALVVLEDFTKPFWTDKKLKNAATYYPQLRFVTTGGILSEKSVDSSDDTKANNTININLGKFIQACGENFRALIDYQFELPLDDVKTNIRTTFVNSVSAAGLHNRYYAYFGDWGNANSIWLPGSAGFLSAIALSGYNVYNRRIAGATFIPAFTNSNNEIYLDALTDWQSESSVQLNPIVVIDAQGNLAVMGSSTLATSTAGTRNPEQALDVLLVGDYITAILHNIALNEIESALDRLRLNSLSNNMSIAIDRFVTSGAITKYDLNFDTTQLGKLGINCVLYFAIGLEEVSLTVTSVYDTTII